MKRQQHSSKTLSTCLLSLMSISGVSCGAVLYQESVDGDLSGNPASPTSLLATLGDNTISGDAGENGNTGASDGSDADYFTVTVPTGMTLDQIVVNSYSFSVTPGTGSLIAYKSGSLFTGQGFGDIDSYAVFNASSGNLLGASDLNLGTLSAGDHSFWIQESVSTTINYSLTFHTVPEPTSTALLGLGGLALILRRRR